MAYALSLIYLATHETKPSYCAHNVRPFKVPRAKAREPKEGKSFKLGGFLPPRLMSSFSFSMIKT